MLERNLQPHTEYVMPTTSTTQLVHHQIAVQSITLYLKQIHLTLGALAIPG